MNGSIRTPRRHRPLARLCTISLAALLLLSSSGCGLLVHSIYWVRGNKTPAAFGGLENKKVAVICVSPSSDYGRDTKAEMLSRMVGSILQSEGNKIEVIRYEKIADWMDRNQWDQIDYQVVGRGVGADMVVAIDLSHFSLRDGQTIYKGRASASVKVYDLAQDVEVFRRDFPEFQYPVNGGLHSADTSEYRFKQLFMQVLAKQIAKQFYAYESTDDFANDASINAL